MGSLGSPMEWPHLRCGAACTDFLGAPPVVGLRASHQLCTSYAHRQEASQPLPVRKARPAAVDCITCNCSKVRVKKITPCGRLSCTRARKPACQDVIQGRITVRPGWHGPDEGSHTCTPSSALWSSTWSNLGGSGKEASREPRLRQQMSSTTTECSHHENLHPDFTFATIAGWQNVCSPQHRQLSIWLCCRAKKLNKCKRPSQIHHHRRDGIGFSRPARGLVTKCRPKSMQACQRSIAHIGSECSARRCPGHKPRLCFPPTMSSV